MNPSNGKFATRAIHAGGEPDPETGAVMPPIHRSSTFAQSEPGAERGYEYARTGNPTRSRLETNLANLENGTHARAFASGMAAIDAIIHLLDFPAHVVAGQDLYGGTYRLFESVYGTDQLRCTYVDSTDPNAVRDALRPETQLLWVETPSNPLLRIAPLDSLADIASANDTLFAVDNTFATPYLQLPLTIGADLVIHSLTKYIGGHSDLIAGAVVTDESTLDEELGFIQNSVGASLDPEACFLALRGVKTLSVRMDRHCSNARELAGWLVDHPAVEHVHYPGLSNHPGHHIAGEQMDDFGGMVSFELDASQSVVADIVSETSIFTLAESLGGVESLIEHPATMTHASVPPERRVATGVTDGLVRASVGIESIEDLIQDLEYAFSSNLDF